MSAAASPPTQPSACLARYFGGDATSWLKLQATYDLKTLPTRKEIMKQVEPRAA